MALFSWLKKKWISWLMKEHPPEGAPLCDYDRICYELKPCDVILVEGRSRVSEVIKTITQSTWSHAALYIGRIHDIEDPMMRERVLQFYDGALSDQLIIEGMLGEGTIVTNLSQYQDYHMRICRPSGISRRDAKEVIEFAISHLGMEYGIRHNLDLARLLLPWGILPRRWRSTLFESHASTPTKEICSSMIAEAFDAVDFPILPIIKTVDNDEVHFYRRNPKLYTPRDFDYSPYFEIIKYPFVTMRDPGFYRNLPWQKGIISDYNEIPGLNVPGSD